MKRMKAGDKLTRRQFLAGLVAVSLLPTVGAIPTSSTTGLKTVETVGRSWVRFTSGETVTNTYAWAYLRPGGTIIRWGDGWGIPDGGFIGSSEWFK